MLIVDDSKLIRDELKNTIIRKTGYTDILEADDIKSALKIIHESKPDLVIIDLALPDGSGFEILAEVKILTPDATTIILTNYPYEQFRQKAVELDASYFFDKSSDTVKVVDIVCKHIELKFPQLKEQTLTEKRMLNLLVVDDSTIMRKMVIASIKNLPLSTFHEASSGLEAIEQLAVRKIDLILLDLNMPDMHGMEVLKFIRSHQIYKDLPVIILTTKSDDDSTSAAMDAGATCYMTKPFKPDNLIAQVKKLLGIQL